MGNPGLGSRPLLDVAVQNVAETVTHPVLSSPGPNSTVLSMISSKDIYCEPHSVLWKKLLLLNGLAKWAFVVYPCMLLLLHCMHFRSPGR